MKATLKHLITTTVKPFRTAVPYRGKTTRNLSGLLPIRDCGSKRVNHTLLFWSSSRTRYVGISLVLPVMVVLPGTLTFHLLSPLWRFDPVRGHREPYPLAFFAHMICVCQFHEIRTGNSVLVQWGINTYIHVVMGSQYYPAYGVHNILVLLYTGNTQQCTGLQHICGVVYIYIYLGKYNGHGHWLCRMDVDGQK